MGPKKPTAKATPPRTSPNLEAAHKFARTARTFRSVATSATTQSTKAASTSRHLLIGTGKGPGSDADLANADDQVGAVADHDARGVGAGFQRERLLVDVGAGECGAVRDRHRPGRFAGRG